MNRILPPGLSAEALQTGLNKFSEVVGSEWVFQSPEALAGYLDPYSPGLNEVHAPAGAVAPKTVEEIQAVLKIANEYQIPLWTVSTGKNYVYGGAAPVLGGSVVLDLKRMRGIEVNEDLAYAIVEPGVSYFDLYQYMQDHNHKLWIDSAAPGWGSVLGNTLDRGVGYTVYGDHGASQCGMEVVLPDGDVIRTGMGAQTDNAAWAAYKHSYGPSLDGLFMQSNLGVVTKMGVWLMPEPPTYVSCVVHFEREDDIVAAIDILRQLRITGVINNSAVVGNWMRTVAGRGTQAQFWQGDGAMPESAIRALLKEMNVGWWTLTFALYGEAEIVQANLAVTQREFARITNSRFTYNAYSAGDEIALGDSLQAGIPSLVAFSIVNWRGGVGAHLEYCPVIPMDGEAFYKQYQTNRDLFTEYGFDYYCGVLNTSPRAAVNTGSIIFDKSNKDQVKRSRELFEAVLDAATQARLGGYRTHIAYMDQVANQFDFNNHASMRTYERLKDALDPNGILSPGKNGVWPATMRKERG